MSFGRFKHENVRGIGPRVFRRMKRKHGDAVYVYQVIREYENLILPLKKPSVQYHWKVVFQKMIESFGYMKIESLDRITLQEYFTELSRDHAPSTVKMEWSALSVVLGYAVQEGYIETFPRPKLPRLYRGQQQWWDIDQMRAMIRHSTGRLRIFLMLLIETGCRAGEALGIQTSDLNVDKKELSINRTIFHLLPNAPKTESSIRTFAVSEQLCCALNDIAYKGKPDAYIFRDPDGRPWRPCKIMKQLNVLYKRLEYPHKGFHAFRRGNITHLVLNLEIPESIVGARVGHLSNGMTLGVYVQRIKGLDKKWISRITESIYGDLEQINPLTNP